MSSDARVDYVLAEQGTLGSVSLCGCGTVSLSVGPMTLRMAPEAFAQMVRMCQHAADRMLLDSGMTHSQPSQRPC